MLTSIAAGAMLYAGRYGFVASPETSDTTRTKTPRWLFLNTLTSEQRSEAQFIFAREPKAIAAHFKGGMRGDVDMIGEQYGQAMWSNYPVSDVPRPGLTLGKLSSAQREAVMSLPRVLLSEHGYPRFLKLLDRTRR
jgi:hypothetical protein